MSVFSMGPWREHGGTGFFAGKDEDHFQHAGTITVNIDEYNQLIELFEENNDKEKQDEVQD